MRYRLSEPARLQLDQIDDYIAADSPTAARAVVMRILQRIEQLTLFPRSGRAWRRGTRELVVAPYIVRYRVTDDLIDVIAVIHGRQRAGKQK